MKISPRFLTLTLILLFAVSAFGQTKARLFTEFGPATNCEMIQAQLDGFLLELQNDPTVGAAIVTYGDRTKPLDAFFREAMIKRYFLSRRIDLERSQMIRGEPRPETKTEIWLVPAGAENPEIARADWSYDLSGLTAPLKFGSTGEIGMVECENYDFGILVKLLTANPSMTVKAVIKESNTAKYRVAAKEFGDALAEEGVDRTRFSSSYVRVKGGKYLESTEIWLVPSKTLIQDGPKSDQPPTNASVQTGSTSGADKSTPGVISGGVINGKATILPAPAYPAAARAVKASGAVNVEVLIDEQGNVISAEAVAGHPLLRASAVNAAKAAKFSPTLLNGTPVKVKGFLVFNFQP
ncbi:MAG: TonB family protein [Acidobacteria bacterium]|nr:TonB family protein [Acidobacteriota bacterium]